MILQDRKRLAFAEHLSNLIADADSLKSSARLELATERSEILRADIETELGSPPMHPFTKIITRVIILTDCASQESLAVDYVIRRFNLSSAGLKKPVGLDLR